MKGSLQDIRQGNRLDGTEALYVADETNHVQFIRLADVDRQSPDEPYKQYEGKCDTCGELHHWRRVWVQT